MRLDRPLDDFLTILPVSGSCIVFREPPAVLSKQVFGGSKAAVRPDPIPNSAVKRSVADGSACIACARVGSRLFSEGRPNKGGLLLSGTSLLQPAPQNVSEVLGRGISPPGYLLTPRPLPLFAKVGFAVSFRWSFPRSTAGWGCASAICETSAAVRSSCRSLYRFDSWWSRANSKPGRSTRN